MKFLIILHLAIMGQAQNTNMMHLNMKMNRLTRITDGLQKDVSDIWTIISTSGTGYKTFFMLNSAMHEIYPAHKC